MYHHYKPLRNFTSKLNLQKSLVQICHFCQNINYGKAIPSNFSRLNILGNASVKNVIYPWELDILAREVILNAGSKSDKDLMKVQDFGVALRLIKSISEKQEVLIKGDNVLHEMHRIVHTQFPWQKGSDFQRLGRYLKIYSFPALAKALVDQTQLNVEQYFLMGLSTMGHFIKDMQMSPLLRYEELGISEHQRDQFWKMVATDIPTLKSKTLEMQRYDEDWSYTLNPLRRTPLIYLDHDIPILVCPIPEYLLNRVTDGIYYDLKGDFSGAYGDAFEAYVGEVSQVLCREKTKITKPEPYKILKALKDGVDWIIEDSEAALLVECKTKGLNLKAKSNFDTEELHSEISKMAKMIVQNYKNLADIVNGDTSWRADGKSIFPLIVSLHDWLLFGPTQNVLLEEMVGERLKSAGLSLNLMVDYPYSIMSVEDYEIMLQVVNQTGIRKIFDHKQTLDHSRWLMGAFLNAHYQAEILEIKHDYWIAELDRLHEKWMG